MSHEMIDEIQSRKGEKVSIFLTMQNASGIILGAVPIFLLTFRTMPWYLTMLLVITGAGVGFLATVEIGGMTFYERITWTVRGYLNQRMTNQRVTPEEIIGVRAVGQRDAALPVGGPIRLVRDSRQKTLHRPHIPPLQRAVLVRPGGAGREAMGTNQNGENHDANRTIE